MGNIFNNFRSKHIPIINWSFFPSLKKGTEYCNGVNWPGWGKTWISIASNQLGDAIILVDNSIFVVNHETVEKSLITKDIPKFEELLKILKAFKGFSEKEAIENLKIKKQTLKELKKLAPRPLKFDFECEIEDIQEIISHKRWLNTKAGQFMKVHENFSKLVYPELRQNGRFSDVIISRHPDKKIFVVFGWLKEGESEEEVKEIISKYPSPYPLEYSGFKPFAED